MPLPGRFAQPPAGAPARGPAPRAPVRKKSKYGGIKAGLDRDPMPGVGQYRVRVQDFVEGANPGKGNRGSNKWSLEIVALDEERNKDHAEGDIVKAIFLHTSAGLSENKRMFMAACGYETEEEYDAFDPDGDCIDANLGESNDYAAAGLDVRGRLFDMTVSRGNDDGRGGFYRVFHCTVVPDEEQDTVGRLEFGQ